MSQGRSYMGTQIGRMILVAVLMLKIGIENRVSR